MRSFAAPVVRDFGRSTKRPVMSRDSEEEKGCCAYSGLQGHLLLDNDIAERVAVVVEAGSTRDPSMRDLLL